MTTIVQPPAPTARRTVSLAPQEVSTPTLLRVLAAAAVLLTIVLGLALAAQAREVRGGLDVIGHQTAPHVAATEDLYFELADMDAQLTNMLLAGNDPALATVRTAA